MKRHTRALLLLLAVIAFVIALRAGGAGDLLTLENLQRNRDALLAFVRERPIASVAIYILAYISAIAVNLPGGAVLTMTGGFLFGMFPGVLYVNAGATCGAVLAFLLVRYLLGARLQERYREQLEQFNREIERNGPRYLLTLRFIPVIPFFVVNSLAGLTRIPLTTFAWTTSLGIIPASCVFAFAGQQLGTIRSVGDILTGRMLLAFLLLALLALAPVVRDHLKRRRPGK